MSVASPPEEDPVTSALRLVINASLELADNAMSEEAYELLAVSAAPDARSYFICSGGREVAKAAASLMSRTNYLDHDAKPTGARLDRVLLEGPMDEQGSWRRKMIEVLTEAICFSETDEEPYYRHLLYRRALRDLLRSQQDLRTYWGHESRNYAHQIDRTVTRIAELEADSIDLERCWYLAPRRSVAAERPRDDLATFATRLEVAMERATHAERAVLGHSYMPGYGHTSGEIHFSGLRRRDRATAEEFAAGQGEVVLSAMRALYRLQALITEDLGEAGVRLRRLLDENAFPDAISERAVANRAAPGQLVIAYSEPAEVIQVATSSFGYDSYLVRYLGDPPLPGMTEDWHLPQNVHFLADLDMLAERVKEAEGVPAEIRQQVQGATLEERRDSVRQFITLLWTSGQRDFVLGLAAAERRQREPRPPD